MVRMIGPISRLAHGLSTRLPDLRQAEAAECGLACLAMVARYHGRPLELNTLRREHPVSLKGITLKSLMETASRLGLAGRPLRLDLAQLAQLRLPAVLHWDMTHFVVLARVGRNAITVHDPALGVRRYRMEEVSRHFTGIALELTPQPGYEPPPPVRRFALRDALGPMRGLTSALLQILLLSIILQLYVLATPFFMQLVVDDAIAKADADLVLILALGFGLLLAINTGATLLRTRLLAHVNGALAFQMGACLFRHLLRLPLGYFEKRHVGDLVSRFDSTEPIRRLLSEGLISAAIDGIMAVLTAVMIFTYAPLLGVVVVVALAAYVTLRLALYSRLRRSSLDYVIARSRQTSSFIETMRAVQSIKIFGRETERSAVWMNRYADMVHADTGLSSLKISFQSFNELIFGIENIVVIYLGAHAVLAGHLTVGMLFAFVSYKTQFVTKASRLVEKVIEFRMLDLHLERLSDIAGTAPEPGLGCPVAYQRPISGSIEVRDLSFRYAAGEAFVFENLSFRIDAGDYVAITGPSGGGKTTLLKVILGLLPPTSGEVLIDGVPLATIGPEAFRAAIGVVMQDDQMMSGTIADNICFFDEQFDLQHMMKCAELACIHDDIMRMPMTYNSLIGDMGTSLSGGQRQRVLLARALYRRPRMLFMDEGTSHLDVASEQQVSAAVHALGLTRLIIAHRPETVRSARRLLLVDRGGVREMAPSLGVMGG